VGTAFHPLMELRPNCFLILRVLVSQKFRLTANEPLLHLNARLRGSHSEIGFVADQRTRPYAIGCHAAFLHVDV
jgi:hypothetical protein